MRVEGQQRKQGGINNETFIKPGGNVADSALHVHTVQAAIVVFGMHLTVRLKATCSLMPLPHVCPLLFPGNLVCTVWLFTLYF